MIDKELINKELNKIVKTYNINFILLEDAEKLVKKFPKKFEIGDLYSKKSPKYGRKGLFKMTRDKGGKVGDFMYTIPSEKDLQELDSLLKKEHKAIKDFLGQTNSDSNDGEMVAPHHPKM